MRACRWAKVREMQGVRAEHKVGRDHGAREVALLALVCLPAAHRLARQPVPQSA